VVEGARLESVYTGNRIEGSNPSVSANCVLNNTLLMRKLFLQFAIILLFIFAACEKPGTNNPPPPAPVIPTLTPTSASAITTTTATVTGTISNDGGAPITARGVCWNTTTSPTVANNKTNDGTGTGSFTSSITGLTPGTTYYARVYATNSAGTSYSTEMSFTTRSLSAPTVTITPASAIAATTATSGGNISDDGGAPVIARGVCWNTTTGPTIANNRTTDGTGTGSFTSSITGLAAGTTYYARAYATNSAGTSYSAEISFITSSSPIPTVTICSQVWMDKNLDVSTYRNGDPIPQVTDPTQWANLTTGAWCYFNNDPAMGAIYGKLYNWYAVNDPRGLAPAGFHVPTDVEWSTLTACLGGSVPAGAAMKEAGFAHWNSPNWGATNSSGFTALPGAYRHYDGSFDLNNLGNIGLMWSSTEANATLAWLRFLVNYLPDLGRNFYDKVDGMSVRCIRD
jgi:uncharacterized protein (TIGR02145 family)